MSGRKQVMDLRPNSEGITTLESNEQQRNWTEEHWQKKANDSLSNYDPTRSHLNFEIVKGGIVQPIDTSKTIAQKLAENLESRGIKDPNARENVRRPQRTLAQFIFSGNRERMLELAFGNQEVNLSKGAENSNLSREKDIEEWAKDVYSFVANRFGEDNIISFYVHLDEKNPHIHCSLVPVNDKNKISWHSIFGKDHKEGSAIFSALHDSLEKDVNRKWGLERGSSVAETRARHRSTEEYKRDLVNQVWELQTTREGLVKQIHKAEIKLKSLTTMLNNLQSRKEYIQDEIDQIAMQLGEEGHDAASLAKRMAELRQELTGIDEKIALRHKMLDDTNSLLADAKVKLAGMQREHSRMKESIGDDLDREITEAQNNVLATYNNMVSSSLEPLMSTLTHQQEEILNESGYTELTENTDDVINCALLLVLGYVHEATNYVESHGGSSNSLSGWGRDKDDDDERWWMRCIAQSCAMLSSSFKRQSRKR